MSGLLRLEINASLPSGVNFSRFAPLTLADRVSMTFLLTTLMIDTAPPSALRTQISLQSGDTSNPSDPRPTGTTVPFQSPLDGPVPAPPPLFSMTLTLQ